MLVYNAEIWPEYKVAHTKSDWTGFKNYIWYNSTYSIRCNFKTGSVRFSMCHLIFWPNFSIIDQHWYWFGVIYMYFWPFLQHYMGEIIYFQRCNAPNGPNISSIIVKTYAKLKKSFRLVVVGYTWYFLIWGGFWVSWNWVSWENLSQIDEV